MERAAAQTFREQLRQARENAFRDAEAFEAIIHAVERLGCFLSGQVGTLGQQQYRERLQQLADESALSHQVPARWRCVHIPFPLLYQIVKDARNDALHQGAFARHLTTHAIELALVLEDALRMQDEEPAISDFMVRNPVCAALWQPVSFVRQQMLVNSFSYLPILNETGTWCLLSDREVAAFLQSGSNAERKKRLALPLRDAKITLLSAQCYMDTTLVREVLLRFTGDPILVVGGHNQEELTGILTAFDLL